MKRAVHENRASAHRRQRDQKYGGQRANRKLGNGDQAAPDLQRWMVTAATTRVAVMTLRRRAPLVAAGMRYTFSPYSFRAAPQLTVAGQYEDTGQQRRK